MRIGDGVFVQIPGEFEHRVLHPAMILGIKGKTVSAELERRLRFLPPEIEIHDGQILLKVLPPVILKQSYSIPFFNTSLIQNISEAVGSIMDLPICHSFSPIP